MKGTKCRIRGCPFPIRVKKHRLCAGHFKRWQRTGSVRDANGKTKIRKAPAALPPYDPRKERIAG